MSFDPFDDHFNSDVTNDSIQNETHHSLEYTENILGAVEGDSNGFDNSAVILSKHLEDELGGFSTRPSIFGGDDYYASHIGSDTSAYDNSKLDGSLHTNDDGNSVMETSPYIDELDLDYAESKIDFDIILPIEYSYYNFDDDGCLHFFDWVGELWDKLHYALFSNPMYVENIEQFTVYGTDPSNVVGHPDRSLDLWEFQGDTNRCALYSQKFIIEELTGEYVDIEEIVDVAEQNGWFSENYGTSPLDMNKILDYYGIPSDLSDGNSFEDLRLALEQGKKVIVAIDADEIWHGEEDGVFSPLDGANHAVEVVGIDYSDSRDPKVILNDSGNPYSGKGALIPKEKFIDSWNDSNNIMVVA